MGGCQVVDKRRLYADKGDRYFSNVRKDIIALVPDELNKVLEVGCGSGSTLFALKEMGRASEIVGIDINKYCTTQLDKFISGNIEEMNLPYPQEYFDIIIFGDVLEHLIDPWRVVRTMRNYLKENGALIASIPNIREVKTVFQIMLLGDFKYVGAGILDKTHLRFFCKKNILKLFNDNGFIIEEIIHNNLGKKRNLFNSLTLRFFEDFLVTQYIVYCKKG